MFRIIPDTRKGVGGVMVSIVAFQAVDPGSIPGQRIASLFGVVSGKLTKFGYVFDRKVVFFFFCCAKSTLDEGFH